MFPNDDSNGRDWRRNYSRWMPWVYGCGCGCLMLLGFGVLIAGMFWYAAVATGAR